MDINLPVAITQYFPYILPALMAFGIAFLSTPIFGRISKKLGFVDLPSHLRARNDRTKAQRIHKEIMPKLGGVAILLGFFLTLLVLDDVPSKTYSILIGMGIIGLIGIIDDKYELSGKTQMFFQFVAALIVVLSGATIPNIQVAGQFIDFSLFEHAFHIFGLTYNFIFPADFITIIWILVVTNALAWVCGIDSLGENITFVASITFGALSMKLHHPAFTYIFFIFAGSTMGFIPYNFPNAKILSGTAGDLNYGFFIATMAIVSETKMPTAIIILSVPLIDMAWVLIGRLRRNHLKSPLDILSISDRTHLHHRLMDLGYSIKQILFIELSVFSLFCLAGFYLGGFSYDFIILASGISLVLILFTIIAMLKNHGFKTKKSKETREPPKQVITTEQTPEERYAY